jgi:hypothetical protein
VNVLADQQLRQMHAEGRQIRDRLDGLTKPGKTVSTIRRAARDLSINLDYAWKSLRFADPARGFSEAELEQLCKWVRRYRRIVGRAMIGKLLTVPKRSRMTFAERMLREGWSLSELDAELARRYGRRKQGGRRPKMLENLKATLIGLDAKCLSWSRLADYLHQPRDTDPPGQRLVHLEDLPDDVRRSIVKVDRAIRELRQVVGSHLVQFRGR